MRRVDVFDVGGHVVLRQEPANARTESVYPRTVCGLLAAASSASCHDAMKVLSAGPDWTALARWARERRASRMLVTEEVASDDMGSSRSPVRTAPAMPYP